MTESLSARRNNSAIEYDSPERDFASPNPIISAIGVFSDDPLWDDFIEELAKFRREQEQEYEETE